MQVWNVLHVSHWKCRTQKWRKNSPFSQHRTTLSGYILATKACIDNGKNLLNSNISSTSWQYGELWPTNGSDWLASLGHPNKFKWVLHLGFVTAPTSLSGGQPNARCLAVSWAGTLYIHFWGLLPPNGILQDAEFTLCPSLAFSCIGSVTAWHLSQTLLHGTRTGITELLLLVIFTPGSKSPLTEFCQLENSLQMEN